MIKYKKGNIFDHLDTPCIFVHGCNAQRVMGSGVAKIVKSTYPEVYLNYMEMEPKLGNVSCELLSNGVYMCNLISQRFYGRENMQYVNYEAIIKGLVKVANLAKTLHLPVRMPFIGGGLGGGDREILKGLFESTLSDIDVTIFSLEN